MIEIELYLPLSDKCHVGADAEWALETKITTALRAIPGVVLSCTVRTWKQTGLPQKHDVGDRYVKIGFELPKGTRIEFK